MGRKDRGKGSRGGSRGGPQDRGRGRAQGHSGKREGGGGADRKRGASFDVGDIGEYADRLAGRSGDAGRGIDASAFAGVASGLAGAGFASRFLKGEAGDSDEDFRQGIAEQLSLMDERLRRLEDQMNELLGAELDEDPEGPMEPDTITNPDSDT